jgi:hypothetical protein
MSDVENMWYVGDVRWHREPVWFSVEAGGPLSSEGWNQGRCCWNLPPGRSKEDALAQMDELKQAHPEYVFWAVCQHTPMIRTEDVTPT